MNNCNLIKRVCSATFRKFVTRALPIAAASFFVVPQAQAQVIIATVNGDPITNIDVEQRMKLLQAFFHRPASHDAALDSVIDDALKLEETGKFKIKASNNEIGEQIAREANEMKIAPSALLAAMQRAGVSENHIKDHFAADFQFFVLIQAYNKGVDASESEVRAEMAKDGGKAAAGTDYKLHQIIFALPSSGSFADIEGRIKTAEQLRTRFTDCASGLPLARNMDDVAVRDEVTRNSLQVSDSLKELLDKTPVGHLTPPERSTEGVEMIAVCSKDISSDDTAVRKAVSDKLLTAEYEADALKRLKELRSYAVIEKR